MEQSGPLQSKQSDFAVALEAGLERRLRTFIVDAESHPVAMFTPDSRATNVTGDWYGEHAGKWLVAASLAAKRTSDEELAERTRAVADILCSTQEPDGYLGTYSPESPARMTGPAPIGTRTWDVWVHAYAVLGLLAVRPLAEHRVQAARRVVDLVLRCFEDRGIAQLGNHAGLSAAIFIDPAAELARTTGHPRDLERASRVVDLVENSGLQPMAKLRDGVDVAHLGTGKAYQICWLLTGLAKWASLSGDVLVHQAVIQGWESVRGHVAITGGPWGGIGRHKEVFNDPGFFAPDGLVETCSTMSWIQLNRELLLASGESRFAEEIERAALNALLGASDPNGEDWCYFTFPNGRRNNTYHWACCKSSGALALEEVARTISRGESLDLWIPGCWGAFEVADDCSSVRVGPSEFREVRVRMPEWADDVTCFADGSHVIPETDRGYLVLREPGKVGEVHAKFSHRVHIQAAVLEHHNQEIAREDFLALTAGPICYASGLYDGFRQHETLALPILHIENYFHRDGESRYLLTLPGGRTVRLERYYKLNDYRRVWHEVAWQ